MIFLFCLSGSTYLKSRWHYQPEPSCSRREDVIRWINRSPADRCLKTPCVIHQIAIYPENSIIHHSINQVQTASTHYKLLFSVERNISLFFANQNKGAFLYTILEGNTHFFLADILLYFSPARKTII